MRLDDARDLDVDVGVLRRVDEVVGARQRQELGRIPGEDRLKRYFAGDIAALERLLGRSLAGVWY